MSKERKDHLIDKLIDGARALNDFFDLVLKDPSLKPEDMVNTLSQKYALTQSQIEELKRISIRVSKARKIVQYLDQKYEPSKKGNLEGRLSLYKKIFEKTPPKERFSIRPFVFAFGLYLPASYLGNIEGSLGNVNSLLEEVLGYNEKVVQKNKENFKGLNVLTFKINYDHPNFLVEAVEKGFGNTSVERHELKHIIDRLSDGPLSELSADLFAGISRDNLEDEERLRLKNRVEVLERRLKKEEQLRLQNAEITKKQIGEIRRLLEEKQLPIQTVEEISKKGINRRVLSYLVSKTNPYQLKNRLAQVSEYINRN